jgi:5-hydroxyisourate hydrolase
MMIRHCTRPGILMAALFALASPIAASTALAQQAPVAQEAATGRLTTHVLDTLSGRPGGGIRIDFAVPEGEDWRVVKTLTTNADGRTDQPVLTGETMAIGRYRLVFHVGEYFRRLGVPLADPSFLDRVPVDFAIRDARAHDHVPLLVTPWSYSTYRGS